MVLESLGAAIPTIRKSDLFYFFIFSYNFWKNHTTGIFEFMKTYEVHGHQFWPCYECFPSSCSLSLFFSQIPITQNQCLFESRIQVIILFKKKKKFCILLKRLPIQMTKWLFTGQTSLSPNLIFHHLRGTVHLNHIWVPQGLNSLYSSYTATWYCWMQSVS